MSRSLIRRCQANEPAAFDELFRQHEAYLYKICYFYCQDNDEALDIMQEVFIRVFRHIGQFDDARPLLPWLKRIAVNTCLNYQRDQKTKHTRLTGDGYSLLDSIPGEDCVEDTVMSHDYQEILQSAIRSLGDNCRIALTLRYSEGLRYDEIARLLNQPLGTVKSNIHRGRSLLKEHLLRLHLLEE